ncbi:hypothetical protein [Budvicia aquatica]|uniref:hypothetical protein n=1 Tax=Budvicia aquatica TaxID=82979 RepID=UPI00208CABF3|nr:hypothetical protein [Budvicia aquatica]GKX50337.1 hypothetical protein SOASR029_06460 [Budvicia aquatica]
MKKEVCGLCNNEIIIGEPRFSFPILPDWHPLSRYNGCYHVSCLIKIGGDVSSLLADVFYSFYKEKGYVVYRVDNVIVRNESDFECIVVLLGDDFVDFFIPYRMLTKITDLKANEKIWLGINRLISIWRDENDRIFIYYRDSDAKLNIQSLCYKNFVNLINSLKDCISSSGLPLSD